MPCHTDGTVEPKTAKVSLQRYVAILKPHMVPPTWAKKILRRADVGTVMEACCRGAQTAESLIECRIFLPEADPKVRELLDVGLARGRLHKARWFGLEMMKALCESRWTNLFQTYMEEWTLNVS